MAEPRRREGTDHAVMRELNRALVLDLIRERSPVSRAAIARETSLAKPTVSAIVDELVAEDLVREAGRTTPADGGGRPAILLELNASAQHVVGIHVGITATDVVVADARGDEVARTTRPTPGGGARRALRALAGWVDALLAEAGIERSTLTAVGVCLPGLVDAPAGVCLLAPNLGWRDVPVAEVLGAALPGVAVHVANTSQACAVAEAVDGAAKGDGDVVFLYCGTGVGAGILAGGSLFHGVRGIAGEIGHVPVPGRTDPCSCGNGGCLEAVASVPAIERAGGRTLPELADRAAAGDRRAAKVLGDAGTHLGRAVATIVNLCNPSVVVIGGRLAEAGAAVLDPLRAEAARSSMPQAWAEVSVVPWALGDDARVRGAVLVALQRSSMAYRVMFG